LKLQSFHGIRRVGLEREGKRRRGVEEEKVHHRRGSWRIKRSRGGREGGECELAVSSREWSSFRRGGFERYWQEVFSALHFYRVWKR